MFRIDGTDNVAVKPAKSAVGTQGYFRKADTTTSTRGTVVTTDWLNAVQDEIAGVIEAAGLVLNKADDGQLEDALKAWVEIAGVISDLADTGSVSTTHTRVVVGSTNSRAQAANTLAAASQTSSASGTESAVIACDTSQATGDQTAALASTNTIAGGVDTAIIASDTSQCGAGASGQRAIVGSATCTISTTTDHAAIIASDTCNLTGNIDKAILASAGCDVDGDRAATIASFNGCNVDASVSAVVAGDDAQVSSTGSTLFAAAVEAVYLAGDTSATIASEGATVLGIDCQNNGQRTAIIASYGGAATQTIVALGVTDSIVAASNYASLANGDRCAIIACTEATISSSSSEHAIVACEGGATISASGPGCAIIASIDDGSAAPAISGAGATASAIVASIGDIDVTGQGSAAVACTTGAGTGPVVSGDHSAAIGSDGVFDVSSNNCVVLASSWGPVAINLATDANKVVMGNTAGGPGVGPLPPSLRTNVIDTVTGGVLADAAYVATGADYAECFPNLITGEIPGGLLVAHELGRVRPAQEGDRVLGVVSVDPTVVGNASPLHWHGLLERDATGRVIRDEDRRGRASEGLDMEAHTSGEYRGRHERPEEWTVVGLLGQVAVLVDDTVGEGGFVVPGRDGIGTASDEPGKGRPVEVLRMIRPGVALCLVG